MFSQRLLRPIGLRLLGQTSYHALLLEDPDGELGRRVQSAGAEPAKKFFMWIEPGVHPKIPDGRKDDTHFVEAGANAVAGMAVAEMKAQKLPLAQWLK